MSLVKFSSAFAILLLAFSFTAAQTQAQDPYQVDAELSDPFVLPGGHLDLMVRTYISLGDHERNTPGGYRATIYYADGSRQQLTGTSHQNSRFLVPSDRPLGPARILIEVNRGPCRGKSMTIDFTVG